MTWFHSVLFCHNIDEVPKDLTLVSVCSLWFGSMSSHLERPCSLLHTSCTRLLSPDLAASSQFISVCSVSEQCLFFKVKSPQAKDCVSVGSREILPFAFFCFWGHVHSSPRGSSSTFKASGVWSSETFL